MTKEELQKLRDVDIRTVDRSKLVDVNTVKIDESLALKERVKDYMQQIKNPYCYIDHGVVVKISFGGKKNLEDCFRTVVFSESNLI